MTLIDLIPLSKPVAISEMLILMGATAFLGWLLGRWLAFGPNEKLRLSLAESERELNICHKEQLKRSSDTPVNYTKTPSMSNLKVIEGIGPKIEQLLHDDGILTFEQLAKTSQETIKKALTRGGTHYLKLHDPATWPHQAALARDGKWLELGELQDRLDGGEIV